MRAAQIATHRTCNQACRYCVDRSPTDDPSFSASVAVLRRVASAIASGADEIVLTGGEPTMRRDLPVLIAKAREAGARSVALETNGTLVDDALAKRLFEAGLRRAVVHFAGPPDEADRITRDPGGIAATFRGARALVAAGVTVDASVVVAASTEGSAARVPAALLEALGPDVIGTLWIATATRAPTDDEILPLERAAAVVCEIEAAARAVGLGTKLDPSRTLPPCLFRAGDRPHHLFSMTPGSTGDLRDGHVRVAACEGCSVRDRCGGMPARPVELHGTPTLHPPKGDKARRRLAVVGTLREQIAREMVSPNLTQGKDGNLFEEIIRTNFRCNQACEFCFVSTHLPAAPTDAVREAIRGAGARDAKITLSGGEPTLHPDLVELVRLAKSVSRHPIQLQTNAVLLDDRALAEALAHAGVDQAFVSLHGSTATISDAVTGAPGTFERTVVGVDHLVQLGVATVLNFVLCGKNVDDLVPTVRMVAARWPKATFSLSFVAASTDMVPRDAELVPRYTRAMPAIAEALLEAEHLGVTVTGFESMCGLPLCLVPTSMGRFLSLSDLPEGFDRGEFLKPEPCGRCALQKKCFGLRRGYAELHGAGEVRPVE
jgi:MoaA/NifB/PqqE/SkfB family radical SAM enzyme